MNVSNFKRAYRTFLQLLCVSLLSFALAPQVHADNWDKQTKFTFSEAVQIPGQILPAGTYVFRLLDSTSDRHIVQVFDETGQKLITTVLAIPNYRLEPKGKTVVKFDERPSGTPEAIKAWFYPGDSFGQEFVYGKGELLQTGAITTAATEVAQNTVPAEEPKPAVVETAPTPPAEPPTPEPPKTDMERDATPTPAPEASAPPAAVTPAPAEPEELPKTGSELPLIGLLGLASLGSGLMVGNVRRRVN